MDKLVYLNDVLSCITVYSDVTEDEVVRHFRSLIKNIVSPNPDFGEILTDYGNICRILYHSEYKGCLPDYLFDKILVSKNIYTLYCANSAYSMVPTAVKTAVSFDLNALYILSQLTSKQIHSKLLELFCEKENIIEILPSYITEAKKFKTTDSWGNCLTMLADFHRKNSMAVFAKHYAFCYRDSKITPIENVNTLTFHDIQNYPAQKQLIVNNTSSFISKQKSHNALMCGKCQIKKSSFLVAAANEYHEQGLRVIQITDADKLYDVMEEIRDIPLRFIVFVDSIGAEYLDKIRSLFASLYSVPDNVLIYATAADFGDDETFKSFSEVFGLTVDFST